MSRTQIDLDDNVWNAILERLPLYTKSWLINKLSYEFLQVLILSDVNTKTDLKQAAQNTFDTMEK